MVLIKKKPPNPDRKLMIIASTAMKDVLKEMEVVDCFNVSMNVPSLRLRQEITHILNDYKCSSQVCDKIS